MRTITEPDNENRSIEPGLTGEPPDDISQNSGDNTGEITGPEMSGPGFMQELADVLRGRERDFTSGSIMKAVILLSIPMVLEMVMESIFAVVDIFFVARLGAEAVATVGITEAMITVIYALAMGLAIATTALVSRRTGEKNRADASKTAAQAILVGVIISLPISLLGLFYAPQLLDLMGASETIVGEMSSYTTILLAGNGIIMLLFVINAVFRGAGDAGVAMRVLIFANLMNIVLDPLLIFGIGPFPEMGIAGAAWATTIGRGLGVVYQFWLLSGSRSRVALIPANLIPDMALIRRIVRITLGGVGQYMIAMLSWVVLMRIMAEFGSEVLAGYTIAIRVVMFTLLPAWGISNAAATLVGQNLGAMQPGRAERSVWITSGINTFFMVLVGVTFFFQAAPIIELFTTEAAVVAAGASCLRIICFGYIFYGLGMVMSQSFNGAGDTVTPTILNFVCFWLIEIPLAYVLAMTFGMQEAGVFYSIVIAESMLGFLGVILFRRGRWKERKV
jgi:putative MATE family efflux protein